MGKEVDLGEVEFGGVELAEVELVRFNSRLLRPPQPLARKAATTHNEQTANALSNNNLFVTSMALWVNRC